MKAPHAHNVFGFTIMELLVVIVMVSIIAGFAIPGYQRTKDRAEEKEVLASMQMIYEAQLNYEQEHGEWFPAEGSGNQSISQMNAALHLNLINYGTATYTCSGGDVADGYDCHAFRGNAEWELRMRAGWGDFVPGTNPCCTARASCPTVADCS